MDSMVLLHYDNLHSEVRNWWESKLEEGREIHVSQISLMERLKGIAGLPEEREKVLEDF